MNEHGSVILSPAEMQMSLEDRREARKEKLARWIQEHPQEWREQAVMGKIAAWEKGWKQSQVLPWQKSLTPDGPVTDAKRAVRNDAKESFVQWDVPTVRRRTIDQRIESMVQRLKACRPELQEALLARIAGEYWKDGMPVAHEDLRRVAAHYLNAGDTNQALRVTRKESTHANRTTHQAV